MGDAATLQVYGGAYDDVGDAMKDLAEIQSLNVEGEIGDYDAGIVTREPSGKIIVSNADSSGRFKVAAAGTVIGAVLGAVFPPSMIAMAAIGGGVGAIAGGAKKHLGRGDIASLGDLLNPGESGILFVSDRVSEKAVKTLLVRAKRGKVVEVEGDADAIITAVREAAGK